MSLTVASNIAESALSTTAERTNVASRNVARSDVDYATRKTSHTVSGLNGGVRLGAIVRATDEALLKEHLNITSAVRRDDVISNMVDRLHDSILGPNLETSPTILFGEFESSLRTFATSPSDSAAAQSVVHTATALANRLNEISTAVQDVRRQADADLATSVSRINNHLADYAALDQEIVRGINLGEEVTDQLDQRDGILRQLAEEIGIRTLQKANGSISIYTDSGLTLFDTIPRSVSFDPTANFGAGVTGNPILVDGVPVSGNSSALQVRSGQIYGLLTIRDDVAVTIQRQMDELARGLVEAFAEQDQSAVPSLPDQPGLFTFDGAVAIPPTGSVVDGLASILKVSPNVQIAAGGDPFLLRDGGISDPGNPAYTYNATGAAGFADRLHQMIDALGQTRDFDPASHLDPNASVISNAADAVGWLSETYKNAENSAEYQSALLAHSSDTIHAETGISLDDQMIKLLDFERSYQASSKLIAAIDRMLQTLIANIR